MENNNINVDLIRGHVDTIILRSILDEDKYGLEILNYIKEKSNSMYSLKQPTLYSCLKRLEKIGYIRSYKGDMSNGAKRVYYNLLPDGRDFVMQDQYQWEFSRTIIDNLLSDKDFDPTTTPPFNPTEFRPMTKRQSPKGFEDDFIVSKLSVDDREIQKQDLPYSNNDTNTIENDEESNFVPKSAPKNFNNILKSIAQGLNNESLPEVEEKIYQQISFEAGKNKTKEELSEEILAKKINEKTKQFDSSQNLNIESYGMQYPFSAKNQGSNKYNSGFDVYSNSTYSVENENPSAKYADKVKKIFFSDDDAEITDTQNNELKENSTKISQTLYNDSDNVAQENVLSSDILQNDIVNNSVKQDIIAKNSNDANLAFENKATLADSAQDCNSTAAYDNENNFSYSAKGYSETSHTEHDNNSMFVDDFEHASPLSDNNYNKFEGEINSENNEACHDNNYDEHHDKKLSKHDKKNAERENNSGKYAVRNDNKHNKNLSSASETENYYVSTRENEENQHISETNSNSSANVGSTNSTSNSSKAATRSVNYIKSFGEIYNNQQEITPPATQEKTHAGVDYDFLTMNDLKEKLNKEGYSFKPYYKKNTVEYFVNKYYYNSKVLLFSSLVFYLFIIVESLIIFFTTKTALPNQLNVMLICLFVPLIYPLYALIKFLISPKQRKPSNFNFKSALLTSFIIIVNAGLIIACLAFLAFQATFSSITSLINPLIVPLTLLLNIPIAVLIYQLFYSSKKFFLR